MNRTDFLRKITRYLLLAVLGITALFLGRKVTLASDCSACPGKGVCAGTTDCSKY
jgi:hypothetical protein